MSFSSLYQNYNNHMCLSIFKKFSQVRVVAHGPHVLWDVLTFLDKVTLISEKQGNA